MTELTAFGGLAEARGWPVAEHVDTTEWSPALEESYRTFAPALLGYFRSHRVDQAEDLVGDVFVSVARNLRRFHGDPDDFRRWVFAIAHRRRVDHVRRWRVDGASSPRIHPSGPASTTVATSTSTSLPRSASSPRVSVRWSSCASSPTSRSRTSPESLVAESVR